VGQHVVIGVSLFVPRAFGLVRDDETSGGNPVPNLIHRRVVVVIAVGLLERLPRDHGKTRSPGLFGEAV
jgi:hypothetical protein